MGGTDTTAVKNPVVSLIDSILFKGKKGEKGSSKPVSGPQYTTNVQWEGPLVRDDGSTFRTSKIVKIDVSDKVSPNTDPSYRPKIIIKANKVDYQVRSLINGATGDAALTPWKDGGQAPVKLYIKSVKLIDKSHGKIYGLDTSGRWVELKGDHPVTAPELSAGIFDLAGGQREFTLPEALLNSETGNGNMEVCAVVEYGIDTSTIVDLNAMKRYSVGSAQKLLFDPDEGIVTVYNNRVRWTGYHADDLNRVLVDPYDPTKPYDPNTNPYYVGLKRLAPINLEVTVKY